MNIKNFKNKNNNLQKPWSNPITNHEIYSQNPQNPLPKPKSSTTTTTTATHMNTYTKKKPNHNQHTQISIPIMIIIAKREERWTQVP